MRLDLFCEDDQKLICSDCTVKMHRDHQYELVTKAFQKHQSAISAQLEPVEEQLCTVSVRQAIQEMDAVQGQIVEQQKAIKDDMLEKTRQIHEALEVRTPELLGQLGRTAQQKLGPLLIWREELSRSQKVQSSTLTNQNAVC